MCLDPFGCLQAGQTVNLLPGLHQLLPGRLWLKGGGGGARPLEGKENNNNNNNPDHLSETALNRSFPRARQRVVHHLVVLFSCVPVARHASASNGWASAAVGNLITQLRRRHISCNLPECHPAPSKPELNGEEMREVCKSGARKRTMTGS